jgi:hypothetical protein
MREQLIGDLGRNLATETGRGTEEPAGTAGSQDLLKVCACSHVLQGAVRSTDCGHVDLHVDVCELSQRRSITSATGPARLCHDGSTVLAEVGVSSGAHLGAAEIAVELENKRLTPAVGGVIKIAARLSLRPYAMKKRAPPSLPG